MPSPNRSTPGRTSISDVDRRDRASTASRCAAFHGADRPAGGRTRAARRPSGSGPPTRNRRAPSRPARSRSASTARDSSIADRQADERGADRRVAEHALEDQALVAERHVQRAVDEERREVDRRERPRPEQARAARAGSGGSPSGSGTGPARRRRRRSRPRRAVSAQACAWPRISPNASPPTASAATSAPSQSKPPGRLGVARLLDVAQRRPQGEGQQRDVDQERDPPADGVDHGAADDRPEHRQRRGGGRPDAEGAARARRPRTPG